MFKELWNTKDKRKGLLGSIAFHLLLLLIFLFFGLTYYEPKPEDGILINFGNSETGCRAHPQSDLAFAKFQQWLDR